MKVNTDTADNNTAMETPQNDQGKKGFQTAKTWLLLIGIIVVALLFMAGAKELRKQHLERDYKAAVTDTAEILSEYLSFGVQSMTGNYSETDMAALEAELAELETRFNALSERLKNLQLTEKDEEQFITEMTGQFMEEMYNGKYGDLISLAVAFGGGEEAFTGQVKTMLFPKQ